MGISGLLPFVERSTRRVNVRDFSGHAVGVDAYCWLHRGAFGCAEQLAKGQDTDAYVHYCLKFVNMLVSNRIRPVLVFDGRALPSKADTELSRRDTRKKNKALAADHLRAGRLREARQCMQRSVDVTPQMAHQLIKACRQRGIDTLVAPYEADAQLAYLARRGIVDLVITEDSDLLVFGCPRVLFKMDINGLGQLVESDRLHLSLKQSADKFSMDKFRMVCILSGCDYLASLPGIGLTRASRLFVRASSAEVRPVLSRLPSYLNMTRLKVSEEYKDAFECALNTFLYQLVFDPWERRVVPLTPYPPGMSAVDFPYAGAPMDDATGLQHALGNLNPSTGHAVDNYSPDPAPKTSIWCGEPIPATPQPQKPVTRLRTPWTVPLPSKPRAVTPEPKCTDDQLLSLYRTSEPTPTRTQEQTGKASDSALGDVIALDWDTCEVELDEAEKAPPSEDVSSAKESGDSDDKLEEISPKISEQPVESVVDDSEGRTELSDEVSPTIGRQSQNPFRIVPRRSEPTAAGLKKRLFGSVSGGGFTKMVTSKYWQKPAGARDDSEQSPSGERPAKRACLTDWFRLSRGQGSGPLTPRSPGKENRPAVASSEPQVTASPSARDEPTETPEDSQDAFGEMGKEVGEVDSQKCKSPVKKRLGVTPCKRPLSYSPVNRLERRPVTKRRSRTTPVKPTNVKQLNLKQLFGFRKLQPT